MKSFSLVRIESLVVWTALVCVFPCVGQESGFPEVNGWSEASEVRMYTADNLWEYINGAAELFVEYEVETCHTGDLASGDLVVTVDYYNMGTPLNAFGVYVRERPDPGIEIPGATEGLVSPPYQALLLKGSRYVKVNVFEGDLTETSGRSLLEAIARALPGPADYPPELELLPENGRIAGTAGFQREGFLGLTELSDCLYGEYGSTDGETWQGFAMLASDHESVADIWTRLSDDWEAMEHRGQMILYREIPYQGLVGVVRNGATIVGASGAGDTAELLERISGLTR